jgi:ParB/RepB/Spo0J family partition protein
MVPDDQLASLVESIKANGLRYSIVIRKVENGGGEVEDELIDGRNRLRACKIAGVEPNFTVFEGDEDAVRAFIADVNLERRDLKKGQKAALYARLYPEPAKLRRKGAGGSESEQLTKSKISEARAVLRHSLALLDEVIADRTPLDKALAQVKDEQARASSTEAKTERLRADAPDLADLVVDDRIKLDEAIAALEKRRAQEREQREATLRVMANAADAVSAFDSQTFCDAVEAIIADPVTSAEFTKRLGSDVDVERLERGCAKLIRFLGELER